MNRMLVFGITGALAVTLLPQEFVGAEVAETNARATIQAAHEAESKKKKGLKAKGGPKAGSGSDISPWTVTHGGSGARYHKAPKGGKGLKSK